MDELRFSCDVTKLGVTLAQRFRALPHDDDFERRLRGLGARLHAGLTVTAGTCDAAVSSIQGWEGSARTHLLNHTMWSDLVGARRRASLLDVGAGAGYATAGATPWFDEIVATETSATHCTRLRARGLEARLADLTTQSLGRRFDVVSALNVLDRTDRPLSLLRSLIAHANELVVISLPLPVRAHVAVADAKVAPSEQLSTVARDWETAACELSAHLLEAAGLTIERLARVPYLSRGDVQAPMSVLDVALWVCRVPSTR